MNASAGRIVFRFEFGGATGWGHLARCAALAHELARRGWSCVAWTARVLAGVPQDLRAPFCEHITTALDGGCVAGDWLVVDDYQVTDARLREWRRILSGGRILAIDDEAIRRLDAADLVVNSRLGLTTSPYAAGVATLLGARFALLRPGLARPQEVATPFAPGVVPVLVMLGGTDPCGLTAAVVDGLADVVAERCAPVVVQNGAVSLPLQRALDRCVAHRLLTGIDAAALAGWAAVCRAAVSACGGTLYELAALKLPFVGVVAADNQRAFAGEVAKRWKLPVSADAAELRTAVAAGLPPLLAAQARPAFDEVDLNGAARVADRIEAG